MILSWNSPLDGFDVLTFYTVDAGRNSTGLGLSIAKLLTERMVGSIVAEYQESKVIIVIRL